MAAVGALGTISALEADAAMPDELIAAQQAMGEEDEGDSAPVMPHGGGGGAGASNAGLRLSIETILISALIFIGIFTWLEFVRTWYESTFAENGNLSNIYYRFWYSIFVSALVIILLYIVYRSFNGVSPI
jgi:hypothetical protein